MSWFFYADAHSSSYNSIGLVITQLLYMPGSRGSATSNSSSDVSAL